MKRKSILDAALRYADRGWKVFPLNGRRPFRGTAGFHDATLDHKQIRRWWKKWPDANVGIACDSQRGPIVVDVDAPNKSKGERHGRELVKMLGLPLTREARSRKGRVHYYFDPMVEGTSVERTIRLRYEGEKYSVDVLGDGGYVIAPPSIHAVTGKPYIWLRKAKIVPLPASIFQLVKAKHATTTDGHHQSADPLPRIIHEGERDQLLTSLAGSMRRRNASETAILAALREENELRVSPPLPDRDLRRIAKSIARKPPVGAGENRTDLGNARRFVRQHLDNVRSVPAHKRPWLIWDGPRWVTDNSGEIERMAKSTVRSLHLEATHIADPDDRDTAFKFAAKSESAGSIAALLTVASTEPEMVVSTNALDADPWVLNVENGTINLRTGQLQPHRQEDLITKLAPVEYDPKAECPKWDRFIADIMGDDPSLMGYLQDLAGYSLTGNTREQCFFFAYGKGANGKSTFINVMRHLMGDYAQQADFDSFLTSKSDRIRSDLVRMRGARFIAAVEAAGNRSLDSSVVKRLTGGDAIVARKLYEGEQEFTPSHKLFLAANHKPVVDEQTEGFWRKVRLIPFVITIPKPNRIGDYDKILIAEELPGILNWALRGCERWQRRGLRNPKAIAKSTKSYQEESDLLGEFIVKRCISDPNSWIEQSEMYRTFVDHWTESRGPRSMPISMQWFNRLFSERPDVTLVKRGGLRGWKGIALTFKVEMNDDRRRRT